LLVRAESTSLIVAVLEVSGDVEGCSSPNKGSSPRFKACSLGLDGVSSAL